MKRHFHSIVISILISILLFSCNAAMPQKDVFEAPVIFYDKATGTVSIGLTQNDPNPIQYTINNGNALNYNSSFSCTSFNELTAFTEMSKKSSISYPYNPREIASPEISISYNSDDTKNITITAGNGYRIFYSLDDAEPYANRYIKEYRGPIRSELEKTVKAIAYNPEDGTYSKTAVSAFELAKPQVELKNAPEGGKIVSVDVEHGAVAYYTTDGSDPFTSSTRTRYDGEFKVVKSGLYRFACQKDEIKSEILDLEISIIPAPGIEFTEGLSSSRTITITAPEGLEIRYTLDGKNPETDGIIYNGPFEITDNHVIKAVTSQNGFYSSIIESTAIIRIDKPLCWFEETYNSSFKISARTDTLDGEVWYTLDYTDPRSSATSRKYEDKINTSEQGIIKLAACSHGYWSEVLEMPIKSTRTYVIGESGPKGGIIVYDCDADNDRGNADGLVSSACGWRYLEAMKNPLALTRDSIHTADDYYSKTPLAFGYHVDENGNDVYVNGSSTYDGSCTSDRIGSGKANTIKLIDSMRHEYAKAEILNQEYAALYANLYGYDSTSHYAVSLDWFLPSIEELKLIKEVTGQDLSAWSSTEDPENPGKALVYDSKSGQAVSCDRGELHDVYVTRTFTPSAADEPEVLIEKQTDGSSIVKFASRNNTKIIYTLDGTDPYTSETAMKYTDNDSIAITDEALLRAYASMNGFTDSSEIFILVNGEKKIPTPALQDNENRTVTARSEGFKGEIFYYTTDPSGTPYSILLPDTLLDRNKTVRVRASFFGFISSDIAEAEVSGYVIGDEGPAGGKIIYDCDADNDLEDNDGLVSSECGWRFMEQAPYYIGKTNGILNTDGSSRSLSFKLPPYTGDEQVNQREIGSGIDNTRILLNFTLNSDDFYEDTNPARSIRLLKTEHDGKTFNDWFIPSIEELKLCQLENQYQNIVSSSTIKTQTGNSVYMILKNNIEESQYKLDGTILPVRVFTEDQIAIPEMKISYDGDLTYAELSSPDANAIIYYTIDGTDPRTSTTRTPYTERLELGKKTLIRAIASTDKGFSMENFNVAGSEKYTTYKGKLKPSRMQDGSLMVEQTLSMPIHYTLDGSIPTESSPVIKYNESITLEKGQTMKYAQIEQGYKYIVSVINASDYQIGETGPAGGVIIYDCDADNLYDNADGLKSDECGWRYLECASQLLISDHGQIRLGENEDNLGHVSKNDYGFFLSDSNERAFLNGTTNYDPRNCTRTEIGQGINNTRMWLDAFKMDNVRHKDISGYLEKSHDYPARFCNLLRSEHDGKVYDDWFLPSKDELKLIPYSIRQKLYACSSSETDGKPASIWAYDNQDKLVMQQRDAHFNIIPIRAFNVDAVETPSFSLRYEGDDTVVGISCNTGNAVIHYTTDGSTPTSSSDIYKSELKLNKATLIRAIATNGTDKDSMENFLLAGGEPVLEQPKIDFKSTRNYNDPYESTLSIESRNIGDVYYTMNPDNGREYQITWTDPDYSSTLYDDPLTMTTNPKNKGKSNFFSAVRLADGYKPSKISRFRTGEYGIGAEGPEGGTIIYDNMLDDQSGNTDGLPNGRTHWRYIEVASSDVYLTSYEPSLTCNSKGKASMPFGILKDSNGTPVFSNGTKTYDENCTSSKIGSGDTNTYKLSNNDLEKTPGNIATKVEKELEQNKYNHEYWVIPSKEEMHLVFMNQTILQGEPLAKSSYYWTSSESITDPNRAYAMYSYDGSLYEESREENYYVRPIRYVGSRTL